MFRVQNTQYQTFLDQRVNIWMHQEKCCVKQQIAGKPPKRNLLSDELSTVPLVTNVSYLQMTLTFKVNNKERKMWPPCILFCESHNYKKYSKFFSFHYILSREKSKCKVETNIFEFWHQRTFNFHDLFEAAQSIIISKSSNKSHLLICFLFLLWMTTIFRYCISL